MLFLTFITAICELSSIYNNQYVHIEMGQYYDALIYVTGFEKSRLPHTFINM